MKRFIATALLLIALVLGLMECVALLDPEGTQMASDGDIFGAPPSRLIHAAFIAVVALLITLAISMRRTPVKSSARQQFALAVNPRKSPPETTSK